jgi:hypothetical protein
MMIAELERLRCGMASLHIKNMLVRLLVITSSHALNG